MASTDLLKTALEGPRYCCMAVLAQCLALSKVLPSREGEQDRVASSSGCEPKTRQVKPGVGEAEEGAAHRGRSDPPHHAQGALRRMHIPLTRSCPGRSP